MVTVVLTVLGSIIASLVAVVLASHLQHRSSISETRREVYESFTTSAAILVGRAVLLSEVNSFRQQMSGVVYAAGQVWVSLFVWWKFDHERSTSEIGSLLRDGMNTMVSYETPLQQQVQPYRLIIEAVEDLMRQRVRVLSVGSDDVKAAAENVVIQAQRLTELAESPKMLWPFTMKSEKNQFNVQLDELRAVLAEFTQAAKKSSD